ncbi:uncharacterized protein N7484_005262 [Penicillium longicatenatum]|uniref:uncharacterized protein n=1 Tax=Penicillium longicatenatum TaxID=1561947 RepID=UPI002547A507|nr:uncharacterized protein N7484_005262 [Penicillium longicatenatum]KAJ5651539.1 hypothetical protein N7484_005262 [Penicillium longicatenatum]
MGIPSLTKHLSQYTETVVLSGNPVTPGGPPHVRSVVIDGPSLVYHVYYRLLAWADVGYDALDTQPSCDDVSRGVVSFLLQLKDRGVEIHQICFDGALPISKRATRLTRIEKSRQKLEFCRQRPFSSMANRHRKSTSIQPVQIWQRRHLPSRWKNLPENPFMVSAVYEDLTNRWSKKLMATTVHPSASQLEGEYPWAKITIMVPGEADLDCARITKLTGSAVLTNDSDLAVHDLGPHGALVLLNSLEFFDNTPNLTSSEIRGLKIHPHEICVRLGIGSLQRFAYELTQDPQRSFSDLVGRSKQDLGTESVIDFNEFLQEYLDNPDQHTSLQDIPNALALDPRVSELFWQYKLPGTYCWGAGIQPHIYLGILAEDHARQCAWEQGRIYRALGYSLLNLAQPKAHQFPAIYEFVRRGRRIVPEQVTLSQVKTTVSELDLLNRRLRLARSVFGSETQPSFWVMFALSEIYRNSSSHATLPGMSQLERFLAHGFAEKGFEWVDVHLLAQIHAVLYSLRILKQLLSVTKEFDLSRKHEDILHELPPLYLLVGSRHDVMKAFDGMSSVHESVSQLFQTYG